MPSGRLFESLSFATLAGAHLPLNGSHGRCPSWSKSSIVHVLCTTLRIVTVKSFGFVMRERLHIRQEEL